MRVRALAYGVALQALFSGPQPGEPLPSFKVLVCNGPRAGREAHLVSEFGDAPVLILFAHYLDRNVQRTLWPCDRFAAEREPAGLRTLFVDLGARGESTEGRAHGY
ncbi:MAG: hypothetical protein DMG07_28930 [Acidobacteria bacterium]|nr:MAG: hypothetical protein DMG07_28930 [Acidobacteriota bacterium]